jgi:hypothetical protein
MVAGGAAVLVGAALVGTQFTGFATIFGIVSAIGLIVLGAAPGRVVSSMLGSLGLLAFVPWAIVWFFPGEGRAPLALLVAGVLFLVVAVLLTRMRGRLRTELHARASAAPDEVRADRREPAAR